MKRLKYLFLSCFLFGIGLVSLQHLSCSPPAPTEQTTTETTTTDGSVTDTSTGQEPAGQEPAGQEPAGQEPAGQEAVPDQNNPEPNPTETQPTENPPANNDFIRKSGSTALAPNHKWFAVANRDSGTVTVFTLDEKLDLATAAKFEVKLGDTSSEVSSLVAGHDGSYLLATLQYAQKVCRIEIGGGAGQTPNCVATGSEPVGVVTNEDGSRVYVSNMVDGTIIIFDGSLKKIYTLDFSETTGETQVQPFALLYVQKKGAKGQLYVSDFFADKISGKQEGADDSRQGVVYKIPGDATDLSGKVKIDLPPLTETGFRIPDDQLHCKDDTTKTKAGCSKDPVPSGAFPNQLASLAFHQGRIFVVSTCASPRGEVRFNMNVHSCVHVIDSATDKEVPALRMNIQERIKQQAGDKLFCTVPTDFACVQDSAFCYVTCASSDLVMRLDYKDFSSASNVVAGITGTNNLPTGKFPTGMNIALTTEKTLAFVYNENSRNVTILNLRDQKPVSDVLSVALPSDNKEKEVLKGKDFFFTARGRWSDGRWSSCVACHWRGLTDNVTWHFPVGPRQSVSMDSSFSKENVTPDSIGNKHGFAAVLQTLRDNKTFPQRMFNWTAIFDEVADFELNTRGVSGGLGAIVDKDNKPVNLADFPAGSGKNNINNNGSAAEVVKFLLANGGLDDWDAITEYVKTIRSPRAKTNLQGNVQEGKKLFETVYQCNSCHAGGLWTASRRYFTPDLDGVKVSGPLKKKFLDEFFVGKNPKLLDFVNAVDPQSTCTTDADCKNEASACDTTRKKCRIPALGNEFPFSLNRGIEQHGCVLRNVGTFEKPDSAKGGLELRKDMIAPAQGTGGFNVPSLFNLQLGAPYLHNGQYESLYDFLFKDPTHRSLINKVAGMNETQAKDLIAFLLSIDGATPTLPIPATDELCPPSFP